MRALISGLFLCLVFSATGSHAAPVRDKTFPWREWNQAVFEEARRDNKYVVLSLQSWWCPWCHTMNEETFGDKDIRAELAKNYITVRVDQDSRPDISQQYERWGWPATVIFSPKGEEIVKLRGFVPPPRFMAIIQEIIVDPSPVDYPDRGGVERPVSTVRTLTDGQRKTILDFMDEVWVEDNGGWGKRGKFTDGPTFLYALERGFRGDKEMLRRARKTVDGFMGAIHAPTGGVPQVSQNQDWSGAFDEFPMFAQEAGLTVFSQAFATWADPAHRAAADKVYQFLTTTMMGPNDAFYTSMGLEKGNPGVDQRQYARENGMASVAVLSYYDATGDAAALTAARRSIEWVLANRARGDGGFNHAAKDTGGPFLVDTLAMGRAFLALYHSTGEREWLAHAAKAADFIQSNFIDVDTGGFLTSIPNPLLPKPAKQKDDNVAAVRFFNLMKYHTVEAGYGAVAETGMGYLTSPAVTEGYYFLPGVLLAEHGLTHEPVKAAIVGA
ncbi:MAG: DUF255 domain-containing protein, partial [Alphaproteobacteria bacterium]